MAVDKRFIVTRKISRYDSRGNLVTDSVHTLINRESTIGEIMEELGESTKVFSVDVLDHDLTV